MSEDAISNGKFMLSDELLRLKPPLLMDFCELTTVIGIILQSEAIGPIATKPPTSCKFSNSVLENVPNAYLFDCGSCQGKNAAPSFEFMYSITASVLVISTCGLK